MSERPILFSAPMVRAILEGRKTVTRRVSGFDVINAEPDRYEFLGMASGPGTPHAAFHDKTSGAQVLARNRYGQPGDRLWVRETHRPVVAHSCAMDACDCGDVNVEYRADGEVRYFSDYTISDASHDWGLPQAAQRGKFVPAIHMPRWASRITLVVTGVRVERLQAITEEQAEAEGVGFLREVPDFDETLTAGQLFKILWEHINGADSWNANPWVWVVEFRKVSP